jgi:hypothetical protein
MIPANAGDDADVPPIRYRDPFSTIKNPSCVDAAREMSGTSLLPSAGTPGPLCHDGFAYIALAPPPVAHKSDPPLTLPLSFQAVSGI